MKWAALVPELTCANLERSIAFYTDVIGATIAFNRTGFAYLDIGAAQLMLEQQPSEWTTGVLDPPYGRGVNFQIEIDDVDALATRAASAGVRPFRPMADAWYRQDDIEHGQRELLLQDPDGYLLRLVTVIGERKATT